MTMITMLVGMCNARMYNFFGQKDEEESRAD